MAPVPQDADYQERIRSSFAKQGLMRTLGASLVSIAPGLVEIAIRPDASISQQHGFIHAGALSAIADTAAGYAALSLMPRGRGVLTTEFKINLVAPAVGDRILARGRVVKAGCTLTLAQTEIFAEAGGQEKLVALLTATMMTIEGREGISDWLTVMRDARQICSRAREAVVRVQAGLPTGKSVIRPSSPFRKNIPLAPSGKSPLELAPSPATEGRWPTSSTRPEMR